MKYINFRLIKTPILLMGALTIISASCTKQFKLDKSAFTIQLPTEPVTAHGEKAGLKINYEIAPNIFATNGVAVVRILQKDENKITEQARNTLYGKKSFWSSRRIGKKLGEVFRRSCFRN